jgi:cytochrome c-type biogenesis protein CcmE
VSDLEQNTQASPTLTPRKAPNARRFAIVALSVALLAFVLISAGGIGENLVYYWGPAEIHAAGPKAIGATIRLGGQVKPGSIVEKQGSALAFQVTDGSADVDVRSQGVPPQMFREGIGVVVEGTMTEAGYFESNRLMVSHDNEYRVPEEGYSREDMERLMQTTRGLEDGAPATP